jgi:hypothetical protein
MKLCLQHGFIHARGSTYSIIYVADGHTTKQASRFFWCEVCHGRPTCLPPQTAAEARRAEARSKQDSKWATLNAKNSPAHIARHLKDSKTHAQALPKYMGLVFPPGLEHLWPQERPPPPQGSILLCSGKSFTSAIPHGSPIASVAGVYSSSEVMLAACA